MSEGKCSDNVHGNIEKSNTDCFEAALILNLDTVPSDVVSIENLAVLPELSTVPNDSFVRHNPGVLLCMFNICVISVICFRTKYF